MSELDDARARVAHLEVQGALEQAVADAGAAHVADPTEENLQAHDAACLALNEHRASVRGAGIRVGGDAFVMPAEPAPADGEATE